MNRQNRAPLAQEPVLTPSDVQTPTTTQTTHARLAHRHRAALRAARRNLTLQFLRAHSTLGAGMRAAGVTWQMVKGMMRVPDFRAECRAIRTIQRTRLPHRHREENRAIERGIGTDMPQAARREIFKAVKQFQREHMGA